MLQNRHQFPLNTFYEGTMTGNGRTGLSIWGKDRTLNISIGRSDLWDHRGGMEWSAQNNYRKLFAALQAKDAEAIKAMFSQTVNPGELLKSPSLIPVGRITLTLSGAAREIVQDYRTGLIEVRYGKAKKLTVALSWDAPGCFAVQCEEMLPVRVIPAWQLSDALKKIGYPPPCSSPDGFVQTMPNDPAYALGIKRKNLEIRSSFGRTGKLSDLEYTRFSAAAGSSTASWKAIQKRLPEINTPDPEINKLYLHSMYLFCSMTAPGGIPAGLQGPWIEDDNLPPWSGDYHFNINVQMCYWPAFGSGLLENLKPLFDMIFSWKEKLRQNAKAFLGIDDGYMMPHAVDDRGVCMGGFWTGSIDHGSAAWMAQLMYDYFRYTGDLDFLRDQAFDFMKGVMRVYEAMMEERNGGLSLPLSVSPEYRGSAIDAWGRNASFQLAAIHRLNHDLLEAAELLGEKPEPLWQKIASGALPQATLIDGPEGQELALWEGTPLEESHRHHSHLAALVPFNTIQPDDPAWSAIVTNSQRRWVAQGMGRWAGWSMPWAVMLHNRFGNPGMAVELIRYWKTCYTNRGGGTLHDPRFSGISLIAFGKGRPIIQMDAGMGMAAAIMDLFVYESGSELKIAHGVPDFWEDFEARNLSAPGGFKISIARQRGSELLKIAATRDGEIRYFWRGRHECRQLKAGEVIQQKERIQ